MNASAHEAERYPSRLGPAARIARELILRLLAVALQIVATMVIVTLLEPRIAGVYLRGVIIASAVAALLRYRYEFYLAPHIAGSGVGPVPTRALIVDLSQRVIIRCALLSAILLVVTTDLDVLEPHEFPYFQTYLPFVLAIPFIGLSQLLGTALRAGQHPLLSMVCSAYTVNSAIICAAFVATPEWPLAALTWAFLGGSIFAAVLAWLFARGVFRDGSVSTGESPRAWWQVHESVASNSAIAIGLAFTLWGPAIILALIAPTEEIAMYAVAARTAQIADLLLPALTLVISAERPLLFPAPDTRCTRPVLLRSLALAAAASTVVLAVLLVLAPATLALYGEPYRAALVAYGLLLIAHWINGTGRPAVQLLVASWNARALRRILETSAVVAVLVCAAGLSINGPLAAASAMLAGALVVNVWAGVVAVRGATTQAA